jgi:hypothetical protein
MIENYRQQAAEGSRQKEGYGRQKAAGRGPQAEGRKQQAVNQQAVSSWTLTAYSRHQVAGSM